MPTPKYDLGPRIDSSHDHYALLRHTLKEHKPQGTALEFGVGAGESLAIIAAHMPAVGFDSFQGLPEDWRDEFPKGSFAHPPPIIENSRLVIGHYADTLSISKQVMPDDVGLIHIDCDLYSSTKTVLDNITPHIRRGVHIVFDEWHGYDGCENHEQRAWKEHADAHPSLTWTVLGHAHEAWSIRID